MFTEDELRTAISLGREQRGVEFKGPGERDDRAFMSKVVRAMVGLANKRDGGVLIVGVVLRVRSCNPTHRSIGIR